MFTFIVNIDPTVKFWPVLLLATLESLIGIGVSLYYPYNRHVEFLEDNANLISIVVVGLLLIMILFGNNFLLFFLIYNCFCIFCFFNTN